MRRLAALVLLVGGVSAGAAAPASAACAYVVKAPSVHVLGYGNSGPTVENCDTVDCNGVLVATPAQSVAGVVVVGAAYVSNCS